MEINYLNLKRMFNYILKSVPEKKINMGVFRTGSSKNHKCGSTGCVIGHCTILDEWENLPFDYVHEISFAKWSEDFTGLEYLSHKWTWCFGVSWSDNKTQILLRLKYLIDNQSVPSDWEDYSYKLPVEKLEPYELKYNGVNLKNLRKLYSYIQNVDKDFKITDLWNLKAIKGQELSRPIIKLKSKKSPLYFIDWSCVFSNLEITDPLWVFLFSSNWEEIDSSNNKNQILLRIKYVISKKTYPKKFLDKNKEECDTTRYNFKLVLK